MQNVYLISYLTIDGVVNSATIQREPVHCERYGQGFIEYLGNMIHFKNGDTVKRILSFQDLGKFNESEYRQFNY